MRNPTAKIGHFTYDYGASIIKKSPQQLRTEMSMEIAVATSLFIGLGGCVKKFKQGDSAYKDKSPKLT